MNNLNGLIDRLENATSRLENLASSSAGRGSVTGNEGGHQISPTTKTKINLTEQFPSSQLISSYDQLIYGCLVPFMDLSSSLGGTIYEQALAVSRAFEAMKHFLTLTTLSKQPDSNSKAYVEIIKDLQTEMGTVSEIRESNQSSPLKNHLSMVGEGVGALGWITIESSPAEYAAEFMNGAKLYGNRILKQFREKEKEDPHWVQAFYALCQSLVKYVRTNHPKGISWNKNGLEPLEALQRIKGKRPSDHYLTEKREIAIPIPPPLPAALSQDNRESATGSVNMRDVFNEINKGENITSTLKKVGRRQEISSDLTNSGYNQQKVGGRTSSMQPEGHAKSGNTKTSITKCQKHILDGNRWIIEHFDQPEQPLTVSPEIRQSILISHCHNTSIIISGKATAVSVDNCSRLRLSLDSLVASIEVIKVQNLSLDISGTVSSILLDQIDVGNIIIGKSSENFEIYTSKTSGINVSYGIESADDETSSKEFLIPEQIKSFYKDGKLIAEVVEYME